MSIDWCIQLVRYSKIWILFSVDPYFNIYFFHTVGGGGLDAG